MDEIEDMLTHYRDRQAGGPLCVGPGAEYPGRMVHSWSEVTCAECLARRRSKPGPRPRPMGPEEVTQAPEEPAPQEPAPQEPAPQEPAPQAEPTTGPAPEPGPGPVKPRQQPRGKAAEPAKPESKVVYPPGFWGTMASSAVDGLDTVAAKLLKAPALPDIVSGDLVPPGVPPGRVQRVQRSRAAFVAALAAFAEANADKLPGPGMMLAAMGAQYVAGLMSLRPGDDDDGEAEE